MARDVGDSVLCRNLSNIAHHVPEAESARSIPDPWPVPVCIPLETQDSRKRRLSAPHGATQPEVKSVTPNMRIPSAEFACFSRITPMREPSASISFLVASAYRSCLPAPGTKPIPGGAHVQSCSESE